MEDNYHHLNTKNRRKKTGTILSQRLKIVFAAEQEFISSIYNRLEDDTMHHADKTYQLDGTIPQMQYGTVRNLVISLNTTWYLPYILKSNST